MLRNRIHLLLCMCCVLLCIPESSWSKADSSNTTVVRKDTSKPTIMIAEVILGNEMPLQLIAKTDAAMAIALGASDRFRYIPFAARDSVAGLFRSLHAEPTAYNVGQEIKAEAIMFIRMRQLGNLLRVDIQAKTGNDYVESVSGVGLALLRYRDSSNAIVYDPTIVEAIQRAMCSITGDSNLYAHVEDSSYMVFPAEPLVFLNMKFDNKKQKSSWAIFQDNEVNSFYALQLLFESANSLKHVIPIDLDTRDSVYAIKQIYGVENYVQSSKEELKVLFDIGFVYAINGNIEKTPDGAELTLTLSEITSQSTLKKVKSLTAGYSDDSMEGFKKTAIKLLRRLLR